MYIRIKILEEEDFITILDKRMVIGRTLIFKHLISNFNIKNSTNQTIW